MSIKNTVYIDLGHHTLKFAIFEKRGNKNHLKDTVFKESGLKPTDSLTNCFDQICEKIWTVLDALSLKFNAIEIHLSLPGEFFFTRLIRLPKIDASKIRPVLKYEAQQEIPFSLHEVIWDYQILGSNDDEHMNVQLVAIKTEFIDQLLEQLEMKGIQNIAFLGASPLCVSNCLPVQTEQSEAFLNMGAKSSDLIIKNAHTVWFRSLPVGGNNFTHAIEQQMKINFQEAENLKCQKGQFLLPDSKKPENSLEESVSKAMSSQVNRILAEITRSLSYYQSQYNQDPVKKLFLLGGASKTKNFAELIAKNIGLEVKTADPFHQQPQINKDLDPYLHCEIFGLANESSIGKESLPNLLPQTYIKVQQLSKRKRTILQCGFLILALIAGPIFYHWNIINVKKHQLEKTTVRLQELERIKTKMKKLENEIGIDLSKIRETDKMVSARSLWLNILLELENRLPPNIWLSKMTSTYVTAQGPRKRIKSRQKKNVKRSNKSFTRKLLLIIYCKTTGDYGDAAKFTRALEDSLYFKKAEIQSATPPVEGIRNFIIRLELDPTYKDLKTSKL